MTKTDFLSTTKLEKKIINSKKFTDSSKVSWLHTKEIKLDKDKMFSIFMRSTLEDDFNELKIDKRIKRELQYIKEFDFCLLWPNGKPIAPAKLVDLQSMYHYIPEDCLQFYRTLQSSEEATDDVDGFGGVPDFKIQEYDDENLMFNSYKFLITFRTI